MREAANRIQCTNNLKQIALAAHHYNDANQVFPPGWDSQFVGPLVRLLPYVEQDTALRSYQFRPTGSGKPSYDFYWQDPLNRPATTGETTPPRPPNRYAESAGGFDKDNNRWIGETWNSSFWFSAFGICPNHSNQNCDFSAQGRGLGWGTAGSFHLGNLVNVAYADGSVRQVRPDIDFLSLSYLSGFQDGKIQSAD